MDVRCNVALGAINGARGKSPKDQVDVFISYSGKDVRQAEALETLLVKKGKRVWRDKRRLKPGEHVDFAISAALRGAATVVTIWSENSVASHWVRHETSYAVIEGKCATLSLSPFNHGALQSVYRSLHCGDLEATLADPTPLMQGLSELSNRHHKRGNWIDVSRLPTTFANQLFGRNEAMADLFKAWDSQGRQKTNIIVLDAMGGTGKTALIHHFMQAMRAADWCGAEAVYVWSFYSQGTDATRRGSAEEFLAKALAWFGDDGAALPTQHDKGVRLAELVSSRRTLLVLDGLEPLQYAAGRSGGGRTARGIAGSLKEPGLAALMKQLAADNPGLLIVTTRLQIPELTSFPKPIVITYPLQRIATEPGIALLKSLGVRGPWRLLKETVEEYRGHALALTNLGRYLATHHRGNVRRRDTVPAVVALGGQQERDPFRVMMAYETLLQREIKQQRPRWKSRPSEDSAAAKQLALLFLVGLFDRPAERPAVEAVLADPAIPGFTDGLASLTRQQWDTAANALRDLGLLAPKARGAEDELDAHPLVREYFGARLSTDFKAAWRTAHTRLWRHYDAVSGCGESDAFEDMMLVADAITHAALAGELHAAVELYEKRIRRKISGKGLYSFNISVLLNFFEEPWLRVKSDIAQVKQSMLLADAQMSLRSCGRLAEASEALEANCAVLKERKEWRLHVDQRVELIQVLISLGHLEKAITEASSALEVADEHQIQSQKPDIFCFLGHAYHMMGNLKAAERAFKESTAAARTREDQSRRLSSFRQFALNEFYLDRGSKKVVRTWTRRTLEAAEREIAKRGVRASALDKLSLGRLSILEAEAQTDPQAREQHFSEARRYIEQSLFDLRNSNQLDELPRALVLRAILCRQMGNHEHAQSDVVEALQICEHSSMPLLYIDCCLEAARLELASGQRIGTAAAAEYLDNAERLLGETKYERRRTELDELKKMVHAAPPATVRIPRRVPVRPPPIPANETAVGRFLGRLFGFFRRSSAPISRPT